MGFRVQAPGLGAGVLGILSQKQLGIAGMGSLLEELRLRFQGGRGSNSRIKSFPLGAARESGSSSRAPHPSQPQ